MGVKMQAVARPNPTFRPARPFSAKVPPEVHQGILSGSFFCFSTLNRSDKNYPNRCQMHFQNTGLFLLYRCSHCQTPFDSARRKSIQSKKLYYLSNSISEGLYLIFRVLCFYTVGLRYIPVSGRLRLSWRPYNHAKWKKSYQTENVLYQRIAECPAYPVKNIYRREKSCYSGNTYRSRGCCQRTSLAFSVLCLDTSLWVLFHKAFLFQFCKSYCSK